MPTRKYSRKAREKFADHLLSLASSLTTGMVTVILVAPLGLALSALFQPGDEGVGFLKAMDLSPIETAAFILLYLAVVGLILMTRRTALQIYTELHPDP